MYNGIYIPAFGFFKTAVCCNIGQAAVIIGFVKDVTGAATAIIPAVEHTIQAVLFTKIAIHRFGILPYISHKCQGPCNGAFHIIIVVNSYMLIVSNTG